MQRWLAHTAAAACHVAAAAAGPWCDDGGIEVATEDAALKQYICDLAAQTVPELARCSLRLPLPLRIDLVEALPMDCLGLYHCDEARIELLSPGAFAQAVAPRGAFAFLPTRDHFASVLVHELAHAAFEATDCPAGACPVAAEYVAYGMQVLSLAPADRDAFAARSPVEPAEARRYLTEAMLAMAPERFAAAVWADLGREDEPCDRIRAVATGALRLDR